MDESEQVMNKQIFGHLKRIAEKWECDECKGTGTSDPDCTVGSKFACPHKDCSIGCPCPTCADVRKLADGCWHEEWECTDSQYQHYQCKGCGLRWLEAYERYEKNECYDVNGKELEHLEGLERNELNPDYSIPDLVAHLKTLKLWERFGIWHMGQSTYYKRTESAGQPVIGGAGACVEILTDPDLFKQAVLSYLEGVE
jgi:hypothetical protein